MLNNIIYSKASYYVTVSIVYSIFVILFKWFGRWSWDILLFLAGGVVGLYFLDIADYMFKIRPSPLRSIVFQAGLSIVSVFLTTSSTSYFAIGLVLISYLQILLIQFREWRSLHHLSSWYHIIATPVSINVQKTVLGLFIILFVFQTYIFIK